MQSISSNNVNSGTGTDAGKEQQVPLTYQEQDIELQNSSADVEVDQSFFRDDSNSTSSSSSWNVSKIILLAVMIVSVAIIGAVATNAMSLTSSSLRYSNFVSDSEGVYDVAGGSGYINKYLSVSSTSSVRDIVLDSNNNLYFADYLSCAVYKANAADGSVYTFAGSAGNCVFSDGSTVSSVTFGYVSGLGWDSKGNLLITDSQNAYVRKVCMSSATFATSLYAGNPYVIGGYSGDGGQATSALLNGPTNAVGDKNGNVFISDTFNSVIRQVNSVGKITTLVTLGAKPNRIAVDPSGSYVYIPVPTTTTANPSVVKKYDLTTNTLSVFAGGSATTQFDPAGTAPTATKLNEIQKVFVDSTGVVYLVDKFNGRVLYISSDGSTMNLLAGTPFTGTSTSPRYNGEGIKATTALLNFPYSAAVSSTGVLYIADTSNKEIRTVS